MVLYLTDIPLTLPNSHKVILMIIAKVIIITNSNFIIWLLLSVSLFQRLLMALTDVFYYGKNIKQKEKELHRF